MSRWQIVRSGRGWRYLPISNGPIISTEEAERIAAEFLTKPYTTGERRAEAADALRSLAAERDRLREAILWALGERGEFPPRGDGDPPYGWRKELRRRAALGENQP